VTRSSGAVIAHRREKKAFRPHVALPPGGQFGYIYRRWILRKRMRAGALFPQRPALIAYQAAYRGRRANPIA
jgi:hypothetical protein